MTDETPQTPIPDRYEGSVMPGGRGMETHGVPLYGRPDLVDEVPDGETVLEHALPEPPDPIPVQIVRTGGRELHKWRVVRVVAGDQPVQIAGRDESRDTLRIRNVSSVANDRVWLAQQAHIANSAFGFPLDPGSELTLSGEDAVYVVRDNGAPSALVPVAAVIEHTVTEH